MIQSFISQFIILQTLSLDAGDCASGHMIELHDKASKNNEAHCHFSELHKDVFNVRKREVSSGLINRKLIEAFKSLFMERERELTRFKGDHSPFRWSARIFLDSSSGRTRASSTGRVAQCRPRRSS